MNAARDWWLGLERREQWLLAALAPLLAAFLLLRFSWEPLATQRALLERQNREARQTLVWMRSTAAQLRLERHQRQRATKRRTRTPDLVGSAQQSAAAQRLSIKRLQPGKDGNVHIRIENSDANSVMTWLHTLEQQHHFIIASLEISNTRQAGRVNLNVGLRQ